jgi:hypothetical protein
MHTRVQPDPWTRLEIAATSLKQPGQDAHRRLLEALYAFPDALQERPDFDALERIILECNWADPAALKQLQSFVDDFISRNRLSKHLAV